SISLVISPGYSGKVGKSAFIQRGIQVRKKSLIFIFGALALMLILASCSENKEEAKDDPDEEAESKEEVFDPELDPDAKQVSFYDEERINDQEEIEEDLRADYEEGNYAFEDPFIKVDPYDRSEERRVGRECRTR